MPKPSKINIDFDRFGAALPPGVEKILAFFETAGFRPGIVGGVPRDYLMSSSVGKDIDVELRPKTPGNFLKQFEALPAKLKESGWVAKEKGMKVFEVVLENASLEFTLPRLEVFTDEVHHSNFTPMHIPDLDYSKGFSRRDFTANAVMFEYSTNGWTLVDPMGGVEDIKRRALKACDNSSFARDPVRFLRAVRFRVKLGFEWELDLLTLLKNMKLSVSPHYLKSEAAKSGAPLLFLTESSRLRPSHFEFALEKHEMTIREYEKKFPCLKDSLVKEHVAQALFLSAVERKKILEALGLGSKGILEIDLKEINIGAILKMGLREVDMAAWSGPFMLFLKKARDFKEDKLAWLLAEEGVEFGTDFIRKYNEISVVPSESTPESLKKVEVFKAKMAQLAAQKHS